MAHESQTNFVLSVKNSNENFFSNKKVLEIGSVDINGSPRNLFSNCEYIGVDVASGKNVDRVCFGHLVDDPDESYDVVLSTECFEHDPHWMDTFKNIIRLCKSGGLIFFTCATTGRPEHGTHRTTPGDSLTCQLGDLGNYYKNLEEKDFRANINFEQHFQSFTFSTNANPADLYFYGIKK